MISKYDYVVIGAGSVGMTVALELRKRHPKARIAVLEKESAVGKHASGRNSGVLHCGIYYGAASLKAQICAKGSVLMQEFAKAHGIACKVSGKVIVAHAMRQLPTVERLLDNAKQNGVRAEKIDAKTLSEIEPYVQDAAAAIYCPDTAVIDGKAVMKQLAETLAHQKIDLILQSPALEIHSDKKTIKTPKAQIHYGYLINCAGAYADTLAHQCGVSKDYRLIPFKGMYWKLSERAARFVRSNIYPVPDDKLPFLGVHLTRVIDGTVYAGPTAIPVFGRENYQGLSGISCKETWPILSGLGQLYWQNNQHFRHLAHTELAKYHKTTFLNAARKLVPAISPEDFLPSEKVGIRPQLVNMKEKRLEMDYIIEQTLDATHVLNAISPAFTSAFAFAQIIVDKVATPQ